MILEHLQQPLQKGSLFLNLANILKNNLPTDLPSESAIASPSYSLIRLHCSFIFCNGQKAGQPEAGVEASRGICIVFLSIFEFSIS
jgi:hypothetical protein